MHPSFHLPYYAQNKKHFQHPLSYSSELSQALHMPRAPFAITASSPSLLFGSINRSPGSLLVSKAAPRRPPPSPPPLQAQPPPTSQHYGQPRPPALPYRQGAAQHATHNALCFARDHRGHLTARTHTQAWRKRTARGRPSCRRARGAGRRSPFPESPRLHCFRRSAGPGPGEAAARLHSPGSPPGRAAATPAPGRAQVKHKGGAPLTQPAPEAPPAAGRGPSGTPRPAAVAGPELAPPTQPRAQAPRAPPPHSPWCVCRSARPNLAVPPPLVSVGFIGPNHLPAFTSASPPTTSGHGVRPVSLTSSRRREPAGGGGKGSEAKRRARVT